MLAVTYPMTSVRPCFYSGWTVCGNIFASIQRSASSTRVYCSLLLTTSIRASLARSCLTANSNGTSQSARFFDLRLEVLFLIIWSCDVQNGLFRQAPGIFNLERDQQPQRPLHKSHVRAERTSDVVAA